MKRKLQPWSAAACRRLDRAQEAGLGSRLFSKDWPGPRPQLAASQQIFPKKRRSLPVLADWRRPRRRQAAALQVVAILAVLTLPSLPVISGEVAPEVLKSEADRVAAMAKAKGSVLAIFSPTGGGGGSGVVISPDGYALTNFHVAQPSGKAMKCGMADGKVYDAVIVGIDPTGDVALVKLFGRDSFPFSELADSDQLRQGDPVFAMGNPFLLATDFQPTVTCGILSGIHRYQFPSGTLLEYTDCLQTDALINPGNSGGPLFDCAGPRHRHQRPSLLR